MNARYPLNSKFHITASYKNDKSYISDSYYSQPLKMMNPFKWREHGIKVYMMSSAPGLLEGDQYDIQINVEENAELWVTSQSYEKIYTSQKIGSKRLAQINVSNNSYLRYAPLPTIPYKDSIFDSNIVINLEGDSAKFSFIEVLTAGRINKRPEEIFAYKQYKSLVDIYKGGELIYRDNTNFKPDRSEMSGFGMYEGYTHLANILLINFEIEDRVADTLRDMIKIKNTVSGGISRLYTGDLMVRLFGTTGQSVIELGEELLTYIEENNNGIG